MQPFSEPVYITKPLLPGKDELFGLLTQIMDSGQLTNMGATHAAFEKALEEYLSVRNVSIFNNGTTALLVALRALALPEHGEVITTPFTFAATPHSIVWAGQTPVFADIDPATLTLSVEAVRRAITPRTVAIMPVHVYGLPCDVQGFEALSREYDIPVIYDGAHAFTTQVHGRSICEWGDVTMLSFHATKLFNSIEGGALVYNDPALRDKIYDLRNFGIRGEFSVQDVGINGKMNELQAAFGLLNLDLVKDEQERRKRLATVYYEELCGLEGVRCFVFPDGVTSSYQYFPLLLDPQNAATCETVYQRLRAFNVYARRYFFPLCSEYDPYRGFASAQAANLPVASRAAEQALCLPFYGELGEDAARRIARIIKRELGCLA